MPSGLTPRLPLVKGNSFDYELITSYQELVRQNLKNLLLTNPGERVMDVNFGVGLNSFLFELDNQILYSQITGKINEQVSKYLPYVKILDVAFNSFLNDPGMEQNSLSVKVLYRVIPLQANASIEITLPTN
jgi:phage baseplate assembly protein W